MLKESVESGEVVYGRLMSGHTESFLGLRIAKVLILGSVAAPIHEPMLWKNCRRTCCVCFNLVSHRKIDRLRRPHG